MRELISLIYNKKITIDVLKTQKFELDTTNRYELFCRLKNIIDTTHMHI